MSDSSWQHQLIDEWRSAYERANGKSAPRMTFNLGWFYVHDEDGRRQMKPYRRSAVVRMRDTLLKLAVTN